MSREKKKKRKVANDTLTFQNIHKHTKTHTKSKTKHSKVSKASTNNVISIVTPSLPPVVPHPRPLLGDKLRNMTTHARIIKDESESPASFLTRKIRQVLTETLQDEKNLEKEAHQGKEEIILLRFDVLLKEPILSHLKVEELITLIRKISVKAQKDVKKKGLRLYVGSLWFQNYLSLSWKLPYTV